MALGIDIYRYQTVTDWRAVKNYGVGFVWVKLTDGGGPALVRGDMQVGGAKSVGLPVGGYHYAQLSPTPEQQAGVLLSEVDRLGARGLVPVLDIEAPFSANSFARDFAVRFCGRVAQAGLRPGVYMSDSFAKVLRPDTWPGNPVIWIARYGGTPAYGGRYDVHQWTSDGSVPGISGRVDLNESYTNEHFMEETDMTPDQDNILREIRQQLTGSRDAGQYPGWESWLDPGTNRTLVDILRNDEKELNETKERVKQAVQGLSAVLSAVVSFEEYMRERLDAVESKVDAINFDGSVSVSGSLDLSRGE